MSREPAGMRLVGRRIERAVKRAEAKAAKPRRPSAAELVRRAKLAGVTKR